MILLLPKNEIWEWEISENRSSQITSDHIFQLQRDISSYMITELAVVRLGEGYVPLTSETQRVSVHLTRPSARGRSNREQRLLSRMVGRTCPNIVKKDDIRYLRQLPQQIVAKIDRIRKNPPLVSFYTKRNVKRNTFGRHMLSKSPPSIFLFFETVCGT